MSHEVHTRHRPFALLIGLLAAVGIVLAGAPAWAHDELIGSDPAAGAHVDALPTKITMTFSGVLMDEPGATDVVVTDAAGTDLTSADPVLDGTRLTQELSGSATGTITVIWRVVSSDGHPVSDQFTFTVGDGSAVAPTASAPSPSASADDADAQDASPAVWIVVGVVVLIALIGTFVALATAKRRRSEH